jgi:hypothetical protein
MIDYKSIATSVADGLNGIARAMRSVPAPNATPEFDRWKNEMSEASKHVLLAFGLDPEHLKAPSFPCGGGWHVEWSGGDAGEWRAVQKA